MQIVKLYNPYFDREYKVVENRGDIEQTIVNIERGYSMDAFTRTIQGRKWGRGMKTCNTCRFRSVSLTGNKVWKCKQYGNVKRFNIAFLHGWFCKYFKQKVRNKCK